MVREEIWQKKGGDSEERFLHYSNFCEPDKKEKDKFVKWIGKLFNEDNKIVFYEDGGVYLLSIPLSIRCGNDFWLRKGYGSVSVFNQSEIVKDWEYVGYEAAYEVVPKEEKKKFKFDREKFLDEYTIDKEDLNTFEKDLSDLEAMIQFHTERQNNPKTSLNIYNLIQSQKKIDDILYEKFDNYLTCDSIASIESQIPKLYFDEDNGAFEALVNFDWSVFNDKDSTEDTEKLCYDAYDWLVGVQNKIKNKEEDYGAGTYHTTFKEHGKELLIMMPVEDCEVDKCEEASVFLIAPKTYYVGQEYR